MNDKDIEKHEKAKGASLVWAVVDLLFGVGFLLFAKLLKEKGYSLYFWDSTFRESIDGCKIGGWALLALMAIELFLYFYHSYKVHELADFFERNGKTLWICPDCGNVISKSASMCPKCGRKIAEGEAEKAGEVGVVWKCSYCGGRNSSRNKNCTKCGTPRDEIEN